MHFDIIKNLFRVEERKKTRRKPMSEAKMDNMEPEQLLKRARRILKGRQSIHWGRCGKVILIFEAVLKFCACRKTKLAGIA